MDTAPPATAPPATALPHAVRAHPAGDLRPVARYRTASGSVYTVDARGNVTGARCGALLRAPDPSRAGPEVGGRLAIVDADGLTLTSRIVEVVDLAA